MNDYPEFKEFIDKHELKDKIIKVKDCKEVYKLKFAELKELDLKKFNQLAFEFNSEKYFYIFITIEDNPNFCKKIENFSSSEKHRFEYQSNDQASNNNPYFHFDYNKFLINLNICSRESLESDIQLIRRIPLDREYTIISHSTYESISYYKSGRKSDLFTQSIDSFAEQLDYYYIIEIENQKYEQDILMNEDGVLNVSYLLTNCKEEMIELYTMIKYSIFYIRQALVNYLSKYVYDLIFDFCNLPNENLLKFLENFGIIDIDSIYDSQRIKFPLKIKIKSFREFYNEKKIKYLQLQLENLKNNTKSSNISAIPYYNFLKSAIKYDLYLSYRNVKLKMKKIINNPKLEFLLSQVDQSINTNKFDHVEYKLNLGKTLSHFIQTLNTNLQLKNGLENTLNVEKFLLSSLSKYITQYTSRKGFMNIDVVINEDSMIDLRCCDGKHLNKGVNKCVFKILSKSVNILNMFFNLNEGFLHKHFSILNCSYNFNEKNIIQTFNSEFDASKKNKIRIFDIPFLEKWNCLIASLILHIWKDKHGLGQINFNGENFSQKVCEDSIDKFLKFFSSTIDTIQNDLFKYYDEVLPDFYLFCKRISKFPLNKYNCIDNLCHHFTNSSIEILLKNNLIYFQPYDIVYDIDKNQLNNELLSFPNLDKINEPYLFYVDNELHKYLETKEKKESFLEKNGINLQTFLKDLKDANVEKVNYNIILMRKRDLRNFKERLVKLEDNFSDNEIKIIQSQTVFLKPESSLYNFSFLLNLSHFYTYKNMNNFKDKLIEYQKLKYELESLDMSQILSRNDFDRPLITNVKRDKIQVKSQCKTAKESLILIMKTLQKIRSSNEDMLNVFYNYLKSTVLKIKKIKNIAEDSKNYIKIGYFMVNFNTFADEDEIEKFYASEYYYNFIHY